MNAFISPGKDITRPFSRVNRARTVFRLVRELRDHQEAERAKSMSERGIDQSITQELRHLNVRELYTYIPVALKD